MNDSCLSICINRIFEICFSDEKNFLLVYTFTDFDFIKTEEHFLSNGKREEEGSCLERAPYVFIELFTTLNSSSTSEIEIMCADKTENLPI